MNATVAEAGLMPDFKHRDTCRLCQSGDLELVLPIRPSPIADAYVPKDKLDEEQALYPLDLYLCLDCGHLQHLDIVNPEILFRNYIYVTSSSLGLVEHYRQYADEIVKKYQVPPGSLVVEIGSNDGSLLKFFKEEHQMQVLGVDPASRIAKEATDRGIPTLPEFFTSSIAENIRKEHGAAKIVTANNVFAHADDLADIVKGIRLLLSDDGFFVFEVSYLLDIVDQFLFDTVYHEHVSYHSVLPLKKFFESIGMQLFEINRISSKGGSIRGVAQRIPEGKRDVQPIIGELSTIEVDRGLNKSEIFKKYSHAIEERKDVLNKFLDEAINEGKIIAGYGASTTVTTLMNHFLLTEKIKFLVDDNTEKHNTYSPASHIPVLPSDIIYEKKPDYIVILAWQYAEPIMKKHKRYIEGGGQFIIPLPEFVLINEHTLDIK